MAVGPDRLPNFQTINGVRLGTACAGIKKPDHRDLVVMELAAGSSIAGVFTQNAFCAAPVLVAKEHLAKQRLEKQQSSGSSPSYLLVNTGNANAGTGAQGMSDAFVSCQSLAEHVSVKPEAVLPFSTGVIGEKLPIEKIQQSIPEAVSALDEQGWEDAAWGIMTTDTRPKGSSRLIEYQDQTIRISGISKGSGMICPNMATMLAYVATDAKVEEEALQRLLSETAERTFNRVTVDGDTSTNDSCILIATGTGVDIAPGTELWQLFAEAIESVLLELAQAIVRDGEGATKFVTVAVEGANSQSEALQTAYTVAHSPLVKTALFACDPNWGRILAAVGRAGIVDLDVADLKIYLNDVCIVESGGRANSYTEELGQAVMDGEEILIRILLNRGAVSDQVWTNDLSHDYVSINADYRS
ncbi:bifunctional glutamate N-acetyltransferase/amino-acid acetyltransferase ArgJ [Motiliproteus sp. MSK22-1]|uniref:bifunctional glutamate N-acetyltransferase/amino-acid acetyltransferase ArgJ n=1 Tax=Motiliproteus sp. MSK22-1 TaxID=1897630 RepID=UPI0009771D45|nr:bifunctional glutamate N-acetyltransferase/amino-acid acetyltransferase ArgJ [Motiliproteus sp. MSK22-1]OMH38136.1 bifunctional ornithine acetyltransferase/N-acetylglutamate synthase [Motiliproteus sp. MSK22-1]